MPRMVWTDEMVAELARLSREPLTFREVAERLNAGSGAALTLQAVKSAFKKFGLRVGRSERGKRRGLLTDGQAEWMRRSCAGMTPAQTAAALNAEFGLSITAGQARSLRRNRHMPSGRDTRFKAGGVPFNKGLRWGGYMSADGMARAAASQFKRGGVPWNSLPVGSVRAGKGGYLRVKVAEPNVWRFLHRVVWERERGPVPRGMHVMFLDGDVANCAVGNLALITAGEHAVMSKRGLFARDAELARLGIAAARLSVRAADARRKAAEKEREAQK